jgi:hypothetical protein
MVIKRIGVASAATMFGAFNAVMGLFAGALIAVVSLVSGGFVGETDPEVPAFFRAIFGVGAVIILPIFYGIMGVVAGALGAVFYNLLAGVLGGLRIETE